MLRRFRQGFEIAGSIPVGGAVFNCRINKILLDGGLILILTSKNIDPRLYHIDAPLDFELPQVFEKGTERFLY